MNLGFIASVCQDCSKIETADITGKVMCKEALARMIDDTMGIFQGEYDLEIMCIGQYEYWRDVLSHVSSLCVKCKEGDALIADEIMVYIRKDSKPELKLVVKKKKATVTSMVGRKKEKDGD
jgi:hypothetical protein